MSYSSHEEKNVILFVGPTGSGKSHMIDLLTNKRGARSSAGLQSYTKSISAVTVQKNFALPIGAKTIVLVDTPGFNDTYNSDLRTLKIIHKWLVKRYREGLRIRGIIYLHRITDNRISEAVHRNLYVFSELCGPEAAQHTVLVTTMWDEIQEAEGEKAEKEIETTLWAGMKAGGASVVRSQGDEASAWNAIGKVLQASQKKNLFALRLQKESVDENKKLWETRAGQALYAPLDAILKQHAGEKNDEMDEQRSISDLNREFEKLQDQVNQLFAKYPAMHATVGHKLVKYIHDVLRIRRRTGRGAT